MAAVTLSPETLSSNVKVVAGQHTTAAAADALTFSGITKIVAAVANFATDVADANVFVTTAISGGTLTIKTWQNTSGTDPTPAAAAAFSKVVNYIVVGY